MRRWQVALLWLAAAVLTACMAMRPQGSLLTPVACWFEVPAKHSATCYHFTVPERRQGDGVRRLVLPVAILSNPATQEHDDPILYLSGGPGFAVGLDPESIMDWWSSLDTVPWLKGRALILMDQRGTGLAQPSLNCPEIERAGVQLLKLSGDMARRRAIYIAAADACRQRWQREGYDLSDFGTVATAADFAELRRALGIREWNVYGISYGARLALVLMRDYPDGLRSTILDSAYPLEQRYFEARRAAIDGAFKAVFAACSTNETCSHEAPNIGHDLRDLIERYRARPLPVSLIDKGTGAVEEVPFTGALLIEKALEIVDYGDVLTELPALIRAAKTGDKKALEQVVNDLADSYSGPNDFSEAKYFSVDCEEEAPFVDQARLHADITAHPSFANYGIETDDWYVCANWVRPDAAQNSKAPVTSDIPTLVLQGAFDEITPPAIGRLAASRLRKGYFIEVPEVGHNVLNQSVCGQRIAALFYNDPRLGPSDSCLSEKPQRPLQ